MSPIAIALISVVIVILVICFARWSRNQPFLDYMPTAIEPCPSHYKCGATSREQVRMENNLFSDLRESNKFALPETVTTDQYDVIASEAEPTACMMDRAASARDGPMGEGQYTPWDEIEQRYLTRRPKERAILKSAIEQSEASMRATERPTR